MSNSIDFLRSLAILLVMLGHSIIIYCPAWNVISTPVESPFFNSLHYIIDLIQMPLFFALSGYLFFYSKEKNQKPCIFFLKKLKRLILPFFLIGILFSIPIKHMLDVPGYTLQEWGGLHGLITGTQAGHLWFLPTLLGIMIICWYPTQVKQRKLCDLLFIVCCILLTQLPRIIPLNIPYFPYICKFACYFTLGIMMNKYSLVKKSNWKNIFAAIAVIIIAFLCSSYRNEALIFVSLSLVYLAFVIAPDKVSPFQKEISRNSYGLYLLHSPLIYFTFTYYPCISPTSMMLTNMVGAGLIAYVLTKAIRKTPFKCLIGE